MIHLLPEISHSLEGSAERLDLEMLPELVVCVGFFIVYLVEELAGLMVGWKGERRESLESACRQRDSQRQSE